MCVDRGSAKRKTSASSQCLLTQQYACFDITHQTIAINLCAILLIENIILFIFSFRQIKMNKDGPQPTSPMLYDPIPEGTVQTTKIMQFIAASAGKVASYNFSHYLFLLCLVNSQLMCPRQVQSLLVYFFIYMCRLHTCFHFYLHSIVFLL